MRDRIFLSLVLLMLFTAALSGALILQQSYSLYINDAKQNLFYIGQIIVGNGGNDYSAMVNRYEKISHLNLRISFVDFSGKPLDGHGFNFDSHSGDLPPEVLQAFQKGEGFAIRKDLVGSKDYLFFANVYNEGVVLRLAYPVDEFGGLLGNVFAGATGGVLLIILIAAVISYFISRRLVRPLLQLSSTIDRFSGGDYSARASTDTFSEIKPLAQNFNKMAQSLNSSIGMMREHTNRINQIINNMGDGFIAIDKDLNIELINGRALDYLGYEGGEPTRKSLLMVTRNPAMLDCVDKVSTSRQPEIIDIESGGRDIRVFANPVEQGGLVLFLQNVTKLKQIERMRSEFTANVSHELKTPLTSIKGFAETLKEGAINDRETAAAFLDIISLEADRLCILINDILQLSEIETMRVDVNMETFDICQVVSQVKSILQPAADKMRVNISVDCGEVKITANPDRIKQLLLNLLDNAIKYNKEGGKVTCEVKKEGRFALIRISDTGIGMAEEDLPRIFERFYRADKSRSKKVGGTGLGLSIVKHIVTLYGGTVEVKSKLGQGSEFVVSLPVAE